MKMNDKSNNNNYYLKKKDLIVIIVNLLVLTSVIYIYNVVENLKTVLSNKNLCIRHDSLTAHTKSDLTNGNVDETHFHHFKMTDQNLDVRQTRSITNPVKCM